MAVLSYRIAMKIGVPYVIAVSAGLLMALEPMSIFWSGLLMSDTLFAFFFITSVYLLSAQRSLLSILVLALATLTRPFALYCVPFFLLFMLYQSYKSGESTRQIIRDSALALVLFCVVISPWIIRNQITFGKASLTSASWYVAYVLPFSEFVQDTGLIVPDALPELSQEEQYRRFSFEYAPQYRHVIFEVVKHDPVGFVIVYGKRVLFSFVSDRYEFLFTHVLAEKLPTNLTLISDTVTRMMLMFGRIFWLAIYLFATLAMFERRYWPWWLFAVALVALNALLSGGMNPVGTDMSRYSMPLYPLYFLLAGVGAQWLWHRLKGGEIR